MTRKDYVAIAAAIRSGVVQSMAEGHDMSGIDNVIIEVMYALAADNPRFDRVKFAAACTP